MKNVTKITISSIENSKLRTLYIENKKSHILSVAHTVNLESSSLYKRLCSLHFSFSEWIVGIKKSKGLIVSLFSSNCKSNAKAFPKNNPKKNSPNFPLFMLTIRFTTKLNGSKIPSASIYSKLVDADFLFPPNLPFSSRQMVSFDLFSWIFQEISSVCRNYTGVNDYYDTYTTCSRINVISRKWVTNYLWIRSTLSYIIPLDPYSISCGYILHKSVASSNLVFCNSLLHKTRMLCIFFLSFGRFEDIQLYLIFTYSTYHKISKWTRVTM